MANSPYRNKRKNYYSDKFSDSLSVGSIIQVFKVKESSKSFDNYNIPITNNSLVSNSYTTQPGNANPAVNPAYQYEGYLYCNGLEYNINDYPVLFSIIGNDYGGTPGTGTIGSSNIVVTKDNIFKIWPSNNLGTFKVPDLKAKKIVGNGPVWGSGSPTIGLSELTMGNNSIGGNWYLDKKSQKQQFSLGRITTTDYNKVSATIPSYVSGSQTIKVKTNLTRLSGPPDHDHSLLHSISSNDDSRPSSGLFDSYLRNYKNKDGKIKDFYPSGGLALKHSHGLAREPFSDAKIATYDNYNYSGGDEGIGSIISNDPGFYHASAGDVNVQGVSTGGSWQQLTYTDPPLIYSFNSFSKIGGREESQSGLPIYETSEVEYITNVTGQTLTIPSGTTIIEFTLYGGSGSGAFGDTPGNSGTQSKILFGNGEKLTVVAGGGTGGGASSTNPTSNTGTEGAPGTNGYSYIQGASAGEVYNKYFNGTDGFSQISPTRGGSGPFWVSQYLNASDIPAGNRSSGGSIVGYDTAGTSGETKLITSTQGITFGPYVNDITVSIAPTQAYYKFTAPIEFYIYGGNGGQSVERSITSPEGVIQLCARNIQGLGAFLKFSRPLTATGNYQFKIGKNGADAPGGNPGAVVGDGSINTAGVVSNAGWGYSYGGNGGRGNESGTGGAGGGGSTVVLVSGAVSYVIAGVGGGGGMGGNDGGNSFPADCGYGGTTVGTYEQAGNALNPGGGQTGKNAGCYGGGGGGGGGAVGTGIIQGGVGGAAGGPGGGSGHAGGRGGVEGQSAYLTNEVAVIAQGYNAVNASSGSAMVTATENRSYWHGYGGGGGAGGVCTGTIEMSNLGGVNNLTIDVGFGGASSGGGTNAGKTGYAKFRFRKIIGYTPSTAPPIFSVGDIVESASPKIPEISTTGTGIGPEGGFSLPTTQVPLVEISAPDKTSGTQATAVATVAQGKVSAVTLTNNGSGYINPPKIYFLGGAGTKTSCVATLVSESIASISVSSSSAHLNYLKIGGEDQVRSVTLKPVNSTRMVAIGLKVARGNGYNGGDLPENGGDDLKLYYLNAKSTSFTYISQIVDMPTENEISNKYDGSGINGGTEKTKWYTYRVQLPENAKDFGTTFKIVQGRTAADPTNDNSGDTDNYGIAEVSYYYAEVSELVFVPITNKLTKGIEELEYTVKGEANNLYTAGIQSSDITFTLSSGIPLVVYASINPAKKMPLIEPYALVKYLIKAY